MKSTLPIVVSCFTLSGLYVSQASLISNSPFVPSDSPQPKHDVTSRTQAYTNTPHSFSLNGIAQISGIYHFSLYNQETKLSAWLIEGESFNGLTVLGFDHTQQKLMIRYNNIDQTIGLLAAEGQSIPIPRSIQTANSSIVEAPVTGNRRPQAFQSSMIAPERLATIHVETNSNHTNRTTIAPTSIYNTSGGRPTIPVSSNDLPVLPTTEEGEAALVTKSLNHRFGIDKSRISKAW